MINRRSLVLVGAILALLCVSSTFAVKQCSEFNVDVKTYEIDGSVDRRFYFMGSDNKVVFFLTNRQVLHRSFDGGATWAPADGFPGVTGNPYISSITVSTDKTKMIIVGSGIHRTKSWTMSLDAQGKPSTWQLHEHLVQFRELDPHPKHADWLGALAESPECFRAESLGNCSQDFYFSVDFGLHWRKLWTYVSEFSWAAAGTEGNHDNQLFIVDWSNKQGNWRRKLEGKNVLRSFTFFSEYQNLAHDVLDFLSIGDDLFIVKKALQGGLEMYTSINAGDTWRRARFPHNELENRYTILDTTEGAVFISVQHGEWNWGNVYSSDSYAQDFALSLRRNPRFPWGTADFSRIQGLDGVYIANQYIDFGEQNLQRIVTKMSYNKGGSWHRVNAPVEEQWRCPVKSECYLNLHGSTTNPRGRFYSRANALGILLATGNVGQTLREANSELNTYLSNDAGASWHLFANGSYDYEISNHGGLILLASNLGSTNQIRFTSDEGADDWENCVFLSDSKLMEITDIVTEPTGSKTQFIIYGRYAGSSRGVLAHFDFSRVEARTCVGEKTPGDAKSDYEYWTPAFGQQECILGQKTAYVRRKPNVDCLNPTDFVAQASTETCKCTRDDYECDEAYYLDLNNECVLWDEDFDPKAPPSVCSDVWFETKGYRLVPGNKCDYHTGVNLNPIQRYCPGYKGPVSHDSNVNTPTEGSNGLAFFLLVPLIAVVVAGFALFYVMTGRNQAVRSFATKCIPESVLPAYRVPESVHYSSLKQDVPDFADELADEPDAKVVDTDAKPEDDDEFDPRK